LAIAAEQGRRPYVKLDVAGDDEAEFLFVVGDGRRESCVDAVEAPHLKCEFQCFKDLAEGDVIRGAASDAPRDAVDAVGLMLEYLPRQVGVLDSHTGTLHGQSSSSAME
jgi:hypothetical protein